MKASNRDVLKNPFYAALYAKFDKQLGSCLSSLHRKMEHALGQVERRLEEVEQLLKTSVQACIAKTANDVTFAEELVNKELRTKIIMSQWTNKFLASTRFPSLDPITFAMSRFSLNICVCFTEISAEYLMKTGVHRQLVDYIALENELIIGPATMGLVHISLFPEIKKLLSTTGPLLPNLLRLMIKNDSKPILQQCCKLCSSLALYHPNKSDLASSGCYHALFDLILGSHVDVDYNIQFCTIQGLLNVTHESDSNRMLAVELNGIRPILTFLKTSSHEESLVLAVRVLANISFGNGYTSNCILLQGGGEFLVEILESGDFIRSPLMAHAVLSTFSNICCSEINQSHVGSINNLMESVLKILQYAREPYLVAEAANFLLASSFMMTINKARVANKGAVAILMQRITKHAGLVNSLNPAHHLDSGPHLHSCGGNGYRIDNTHLFCAERCAFALATILLHPASHERMYCIQALDDLVKLCRQQLEPRLITSMASVISTMVPSPGELLRYHRDDAQYPVEKCRGIAALKKAKFEGFVSDPTAPEWVDTAISILTKTDKELKELPPDWRKKEFVPDKLIFFKEYCCDIFPDSTLTEAEDFRGLIFSIY